ncbi:MAG: BMP family ABC transporter substrate-binding protein [Treponema sp.]|nr:BMP family ABC transporter substrate-binding protein [Treponema sp.]MCL2250921.1 BMP family ABC transporter substrate-binding protein [Treponema sp.]
MKKILTFLLLASLVFVLSCTKKEKSAENLSVLVFITGVIAGSPTYELMSQGALEFAEANQNVTIKIYEAGINQSQWEQQLAEMVSSGDYDIVLGSNPSLPEICANVAKMFPNQKFVITDAYYEGHPQIRTYFYNQYEQSLFLGYLAGLITTSKMPFANAQKKVGFIAAQEYPLLTGHMVPGFIEGAKMIDPEIELDFRVIGSWADANKAADLALAMINSGTDVFTSIAGGAAQGIIKTITEKNAYALWYNINAYNLAPGNIIGCGIMEQKKLVLNILEDLKNNRIEYGISAVLGVKNGYLGFIDDDSGYYNFVPEDIRKTFKQFINELYN